MTLLITGATGNIGARVVQQLIERGIRPRVFVRDPLKLRAHFGDRVDVAIGDLDDAASLTAALDGIDRLFLVNSGSTLAARDALAADAAKRCGVERIVKLSALGARAQTEPTAVALWHAEGEAAIRASGVLFSFIQPVGFMSNALEWARSIKADSVVRASTGDGRIAMIHPDDIAAVATEALLGDERFENRSFVITGPSALTYSEMTQQIGVAIERTLHFEPISDEQAHANLLRHGLPPALADALIVLWREVREGLVAMVTNEVERIVGRAPIAFATWAKQNAAAFR
ncbi:MAG TPA: NAD(P)H-binding protein [Polyangiales bacterium]|nr:NAD(P)H-binding protein [Polyangiales bacterium]